MLFDDFLNDLERRGKDRTATTYYRLLSQFKQWLDERGAADFDREDVLEFAGSTDWSAGTRNIFLAAIRGWARMAKSEVPAGSTLEEIQKNRDLEKKLERIAGIRGYAVRREERQALTLEQISILLDIMDPRTATLFWILLWFGVRVGELRTAAADWEDGRLVVETEKVGGRRALFFDEYTGGLLRHAEESGLLDLPPIRIWKMLKRYSSACAPVKLSPHICRHTFASHFARIVRRDLLRRMLGHGARESTDIYVHVGEDEVRRAMVGNHYLKPLEPGGRR